MDCLTSLILTCLMQGTYVSAGVEYQLHKSYYEGRWCRYEWCDGPMGVLRLGTRLELSRKVELDVGLTHTSFINTIHDGGEEAAYLTLTWRPFRRL